MPCLLLELIKCSRMKGATYGLHIFSSHEVLAESWFAWVVFFPASPLSYHPAVQSNIWYPPNAPQTGLNFCSFHNKTGEFMTRSFCFSHRINFLPPHAVWYKGLGLIKAGVGKQVRVFIIASASSSHFWIPYHPI